MKRKNIFSALCIALALSAALLAGCTGPAQSALTPGSGPAS